jgi:hypothetical protein
VIWYFNVYNCCAGAGTGSGVNDLSFATSLASFLSLPFGRETLLGVAAAFGDGVVAGFQPHDVATCDNHVVNVSVSSLYWP